MNNSNSHYLKMESCLLKIEIALYKQFYILPFPLNWIRKCKSSNRTFLFLHFLLYFCLHLSLFFFFFASISLFGVFPFLSKFNSKCKTVFHFYQSSIQNVKQFMLFEFYFLPTLVKIDQWKTSFPDYDRSTSNYITGSI